MLSRNYLFKRISHIVPTLLGASLLIFILFNLLGTDPAIVLGGKYVTLERAAEIRHKLGLDKPLFVQYLEVLKSFFTFNFGKSWYTEEKIGFMIKNASVISLSFAAPAFIITIFLSVSLSLYAAFYKDKWIDRLIVIGSVALMSISLLSYIFFGQYVFAYQLGWFPITGYEEGVPYCIPYIILPCLIFVILGIGYDIRFYRTVLLDQLYQDYVRTARAKGLSNFAILFKHVLKNAMIPILTNSILQIPSLILGSVLIESFFSIPGLGSLLTEAVQKSDLPVIKSIAIVLCVSYVLCTFIADMLCALVDPRVKLT